MVKFTYPEEIEQEEPVVLTPDLQVAISTWVLYVDGSSNSQGSGAGIILTTPERIQLEYALQFRFKASNNEVEYEALLVGLQLVTGIGVKQVQIYNESQLVVNQVLQQYEAREDNMIT